MPRGPRQPVVKAKNPIQTIGRLLTFLKDKLASIAVALLFVVGASLCGVYAAHLVNPIITVIGEMREGLTDEVLSEFIRLLITLGVTYIIMAICNYLSSFIMVRVCNETLNKFRNLMFIKMQKLPISFFDSHTHGQLMSYFTNDVGAIRDAISNSLTTVVSAAVTLVGTFALMLMISPILTLAIVCLIIIMTVLTKYIGAASVKNFKQPQGYVSYLNGYMEEMMGGQKVVKVFTHEQKTKDDFQIINEKARKASTRANIFGGILGPISNNLSHINYAICSMLGGYFVIIGSISLADMIEFLTHCKNFTNPLSQIMQQFNSLSRAIAGAERIFEILDMDDEDDEGKVELVYATYNEEGQLVVSDERTGLWAWKRPTSDGCELIRLRGDVRFKDVTFSYDGKKTVLNNVSFYAKPGQKIAFVGATGAGKTTITNLINRFYDIETGIITYDGINIKEIKKADLRRSLAMVLQDTHLFSGTIMDNIRYGKLDATDEECIKAAKLANADEFITMLPQGYQTIITGDGTNLSQGQRQLLAIARAMVCAAPVLVLDEATSSIDTRTEKLIEEGMDNLMAGRTVFVIAHRLSTVRNSNAIIVLDFGEIIERGDHDDLLRQKGKYYALYTGQFELD